VRDVRTRINDGGDSELNFLNRDFIRNNTQFLVFNLQQAKKRDGKETFPFSLHRVGNGMEIQKGQGERKG
jgi:hypothetical protein